MPKLEFSKLYIKESEMLAKERGLYPGGKVQQFVDKEVLKLSDGMIPMDTGVLKSSGTRFTHIGQGKVIYKTPYARSMYYNKHFNFKGKPNRGAFWFERMKASHKKSILAGARRMGGASND